MAPTPPTAFDQRAQTRYAQLIGDKVPGPPRSCLPSYRSHDMAVIDDRTIVFRESPGRVWVMRPQNDCNLLSAGRFALITRSSTSQLCRGEIAQVADPSNGVAVGSCVIGDFVPYTRPGA
ncbi:MAG TPA: hypothetical protein VMK31_07920 [Sphingomicrobium sp.]|nr:hypothetical protein [Sphingomicrobium sp.]